MRLFKKFKGPIVAVLTLLIIFIAVCVSKLIANLMIMAGSIQFSVLIYNLFEKLMSKK